MNVFITGITGTLGNHVCQNLITRGARVIGYSRDEQKQRLLKAKMHPDAPLTLYIGDVRDRDRLVEATRDADLILHFAALKCVDTLEENPEEAIATNTLGTANVLHAQRMNNIRRVVMASTDKAVNPINAYGASKMLGEKMVLRNPLNFVCRYGNVLGSRGSALPMFIKTLKDKEDPAVYITDRNMTRFWTTVERAASFILSCALSEESGGLRVPEMKACSVVALTDVLAAHLGVHAFTAYDIGIRPGEKLHECLMSKEQDHHDRNIFSNDPDIEMTDDEIKLLLIEALRGMDV